MLKSAVVVKSLVIVLCLGMLQSFAHAEACLDKEEFNRFMDRYAIDADFAKSRTRYPLSILRAEYGGDDIKYVETKRSASQDAKLPSIQELRAEKGLVSKVSELTDQAATVELFKPETDLLTTYHFERRTGCWYLKQVQDFSL